MPFVVLADWLFRRARRLAQDTIQTECYGGRRGGARWVSAEGVGAELWAVAGDDPERDTVGLFTVQEIFWRLGERLTPRDLELIDLLLRDTPNSEIATRLDTTESNVRKIQERLRDKFREVV